MDRQTALPDYMKKGLRSAIFAALCFLTLLCICVAASHDIFRRDYVGLITAINILGLIYLTLLTGILFFKKREFIRPMRLFIIFLLNLYLANLFSALANILYLLPGYTFATKLLASATYLSSAMLLFTLWFYQKQFLKRTALTCTVTVLLILAFAVYAALLGVNLLRPILFDVTEEGGALLVVLDYVSMIMTAFCFVLLCIGTLFSDLSRSRKFSFVTCIFAPLLFAMLALNQELLKQNIYVWGIMIMTVVLPLCLVFFQAHEELENDVLRHEKEQSQLQISAMISQMQPHFLYNSLAVIAALCEENPKLAAEATNAFSNYLRENMDFADKKNPISFREELNHIETYVWLEQLRFANKLRIEYDIQCTDFRVPALSVQPMVENAIKHGICKSKSGGTVRVSSFETAHFYVVTVSDDGTGFDVQKVNDDGRQHLGIANTRYRIREMLGGRLDIVSEAGRGTTVTIKIPK